ncbi:MAG TPA: ribosome assembly RNA-binding protein YhbY [Vicinamibacterales bacterium]|nr:ribosome assembly RNA-binding protein YhbY [Vicinamibacterales bacterium]
MPVAPRPRQRAKLKARAHALEPIVQLGHAGATEKVIAEVDRSLTAHGLIKVRLPGDRDERDALAVALSQKTDASIVQQVGRIVVLWRPRPDDEPLED